MNKISKYLKLLILILMISIISLFVGCSNEENPNNQGNTEQNGDNTSDENPDEGNEGHEENPENPTENDDNYTLKFKESSISIGIGESVALPLETNIENENDITFKNDNNAIVQFQKNGNIKGIKSGTAIITASYKSLETVIFVTVTDEIKVFEKTDYRYWTNLIQDKYDIEAPIMTAEEIAKFNAAVYSDYSKTNVYDLTTLSLSVTGQYVKDKINFYSHMNNNGVWKMGTTISATTAEKNAILNNRNMDAIPSNVSASYGIIVNFATMRSYPDNSFYSKDKNYDRFQETGLDVGEAVIIYHTSLDGLWCFVQAENYFGWIETQNVAKCTTEQFMQYYRNDKYMLVIAERMSIGDTVMRMGDKLPYKEVNDDKFVVYMPKRCNDETLCIEETEVVYDDKVNDGYLVYNYENLYRQGMKLLDTAYRWGDYMIDGRDCSSTQNAIFHCFGCVMARNTSKQNVTPGYSEKVSGLTDAKMKTYPIGTLIYTSSHVMMYIGEDDTGACYLLHNSGYCKLQSLSSYGGNNMIAVLTIVPQK